MANAATDYLDSMIRKAENFLSLSKQPAWSELLEELESVRKDAFQDMLKAKSESDRAVAQGYAQAINFFINYLSFIGKTSKTEIEDFVEQKRRLIEDLEGARLETAEVIDEKQTGGIL